MIQTLDNRMERMMAENAGLQAALDRATKTALLEHARMGRSVCEGRDGQVVWITPEEIFARYGLDANGKPPA
ncbi:MAG: hypothetical protein U0791_08155 [Gemmataceae bacterium]